MKKKTSQKTRKIVINACYGGFGLSEKAILMLAEKGCRHIQALEPKGWYGNRKGWEKDFEKDQKANNYKKVIVKDGKILVADFCGYKGTSRADKNLVKVVEQLGEESWGKYAQLKIVEIPADVKWAIEEYDGFEHVAEIHRTWS